MKISNKIYRSIVLASILGLAPMVASAQVSASVSASAQVNISNRKLTNIITRSDAEIAKRIDDLNKLSARIQGMKNVSASAKANVAAEVQSNISGLNALKTKIDADTDATVAVNDEKAIFGPFRIFALIIPQGYLLSAVDRINNISGLMTDLSAKLQTRINAAKTAGKDTSAADALIIDMNAKVADAKTQASLASSEISGLKPDNGDKTVEDSNHAALVAARANIKTATADLKAAREDSHQIISSLKSFNSSTSAGASASTTISATSTR